MDELLDILDEHGNPTGTTALKSKAHKLGLFHATIHVWLYTKDEKILLQKRAATTNASMQTTNTQSFKNTEKRKINTRE